MNSTTEFIEKIAREAGAITLKYFRTRDLQVISKADASPVTIADREAEQLLRKRIREKFQKDLILGEEFGLDGSDSSRRWILDPIDGTKSFIHGVPLYGMLIALEVDGEVTNGAIYMPALNEMVSATKGEGCYWNGAHCSVSRKARASESLLLTTSPARLEQAIGRTKYDAITSAFGIYRGWGDCYGHLLVATGRAEAMLDPRMAVWDAAPLGLIVEEASGVSFDLSGKRGIEGGSLVSCNAAIAPEVRALLGLA